jgi:hypothetical protein
MTLDCVKFYFQPTQISLGMPMNMAIAGYHIPQIV